MSKKRPTHVVPIAPQKVPKDRYESTSGLRVLWSFALFDGTIEWHDQNHKEETFRQVAVRMREYEGMTWGEIENRRSYNHPVPRDRLIGEARKRLRKLRLDDIDELWRFRFSGARRIWGIRDRQVFKVLWWDPQHKICPSTRKHR